jgi:CBS domain-containing protein
MSDRELSCRDFVSVRDVLCGKAIQGVIAVRPETTASVAADTMLSAEVGLLLVMDGPRLLGILTERNLVRMAREGMASRQMAVRDLMQSDVLCCGDDSSVDEAAELMRVHRIRQIPVLAANKHIVGVVSIGDINAHRVGQCEVTLTQLETYVYRRP